MNKQITFNNLIRKHIHKFIVWYLRKCAGAFHHGKYGDNGVYVVVMRDSTYHEYQKLLSERQIKKTRDLYTRVAEITGQEPIIFGDTETINNIKNKL